MTSLPQRFLGVLSARIPDSALLLFSRLAPAAVFWQSGRTKVDGWSLNGDALYLFQEEYRLPLIDPLWAAHLAAAAEHVFPLLLILGLATRVSALALLIMTGVIQCFVYPDAWPTHATWATLLLWSVARGAGVCSLDHLWQSRQAVSAEECRMNVEPRPPLPPFDELSARRKVRAAEDAWNSRDADRVVLAYSKDSRWRNRDRFLKGRNEIHAFLSQKWAHEHDYRLIKELWAYGDDRIAVRFAYEWHDDSGQWWRSYGNENWEFDADGLMARRLASINDVAIAPGDRLFHWPQGVRPEGHPSLSALGL